jgi:nicotinate-nucleotide pyrophosphorylase (carboxylating)
MRDIRDDILDVIAEQTVIAAIIAEDDGIIAETTAVEQEARELGLTMSHILAEGSRVKHGDEVARFRGRPKQVVLAEERLIGLMAKSSGIATATRRFVEKAGGRPAIVSGAWKKMPQSQKEAIRRAILTGGGNCRISHDPFLYLDKNYVRMLGGIKESLAAITSVKGYAKVVQLKGDYGDIDREACEAVDHGADIIFIDSGSRQDLESVMRRLKQLGWRDRVKIAFGGNIRLEDVEPLKALDVDILDIGRQIIDAPLLDMRLEVIGIEEGRRENLGHGRI